MAEDPPTQAIARANTDRAHAWQNPKWEIRPDPGLTAAEALLLRDFAVLVKAPQGLGGVACLDASWTRYVAASSFTGHASYRLRRSALHSSTDLAFVEFGLFNRGDQCYQIYPKMKHFRYKNLPP